MINEVNISCNFAAIQRFNSCDVLLHLIPISSSNVLNCSSVSDCHIQEDAKSVLWAAALLHLGIIESRDPKF